MSSQASGLRVASVIFALFAIGHVVRLIKQAQVTVETYQIPMWASVVALIIAAILIVEFAKQIQDRDAKDRFTAAVEACRLRLRPILMTSFAFIFGVLPLALSSGAGAEMRQALGTAVFFGMLGVTGFGLFLTPVFYVVIMWFKERRTKASAPAPAPPLTAEPAL